MTGNYFNNEYRNLRFSGTELLYLLLLAAVGAAIRFFYHYNRPFVGDEVATLIQIQKSVAYILTHFEAWLTMNYFFVAEKFLLKAASGNQIALVILPEIAGIATIPLTAILAKKVASKKTALVAATLIAFNPYMISYSGIIRSYSILAAISLVAVILYFNWHSNRTFRNGIWLALACYAIMLTHLNGVYTLVFVLMLAGADLVASLIRREKNKFATFLIPMSVSLALTFFSYINLAGDISSWGIPWHNAPPTGISFIFFAFTSYFGAGFFGWVSAFLMLSAIFLAIRRPNHPLMILLAFISVTLLMVSLQGIDHFPDAYTRFLIFLVPVCAVLIAEGIVFYSTVIPLRYRIVTIVLTLLVIATWAPNFLQGYKDKSRDPWARVAHYILDSKAGNTVVTNDWSSNLNLTPYFGDSLCRVYELNKYPNQQSVQLNKSIFFIIRGLNITSDFPAKQFGSIQVIKYPSSGYKDLLGMIRDDLGKRVSDSVISPRYTEIYHNLWYLNKVLDNDPAQNFRYYDLYMRCNQLSGRQRTIPLSLKLQDLRKKGYKVEL